ncbi:MAG TPA: hypothetical protein PKE65_04525, partial [Rhizobiaceae bacterium]|nr:hypothetical protein [Rhizobiaceae bacterium]
QFGVGDFSFRQGEPRSAIKISCEAFAAPKKNNRQAGVGKLLFQLTNCNQLDSVLHALDIVAKRWRCLHRVAFRSLPRRKNLASKRFSLIEQRSSAPN